MLKLITSPIRKSAAFNLLSLLSISVANISSGSSIIIFNFTLSTFFSQIQTTTDPVQYFILCSVVSIELQKSQILFSTPLTLFLNCLDFVQMTSFITKKRASLEFDVKKLLLMFSQLSIQSRSGFS
uniref:(northern house mosquito) hypothetical protein n=1 Tax=Culex pipiens TaxID=7175 RepID=A0A8D8EZQ5_CULPI